MPTLHCNYDYRVALRKAKIAKWVAKYVALGHPRWKAEQIANMRALRNR